MIHEGSCAEFLSFRGKHDISFAFLDPPFNWGVKYKGYKDKVSDEQYRGMLRDSINSVFVHMRTNAVLCLHGPDDNVFIYDEIVKEIPALRRIAWVNWHYNFGECNRSNWIDARCHCLIYATTDRYTWNPDAVMVESARVRYGDKRIGDSPRGGKRLPGTVWGIPSDGQYWGRVTGNSAERVSDRPNQLPEVYLERLIRAYTNPGDVCFDGFSGTGTTVVVANALGRVGIGCDIDPNAVKAANGRVQRGAVRVKL